jgi:UDP-GlcNAc:undecaprenyl-phosphate/decaprenyl-phosphate GlcNAc-1-phosphate transferase
LGYHILMELVVCFLFSSLASAITLAAALRSNVFKDFLDTPNNRSLHQVPIPRIGGLGIVVGILASAVLQELFFTPTLFIVKLSLACYIILYIVSWMDDRHSLSIRNRLGVHLLTVIGWISIAGANYFSSFNFIVALGFGIVLCLGITWAMNLFNFMDGSDGLAGSMASIGFGAYFISTWQIQSPSIRLSLVGIIGSTVGFLYYNWPKAKLFLGDAGSIPLGFLAAVIGVIGIAERWWDGYFPLQIFAMFWVDASFTLARRALRGDKFWQSHNEHWYQRAIRAGNSHKKVLIIHCGCNIFIASVSLISRASSDSPAYLDQATTITLILVAVLTFGLWSEYQFRRFQTKRASNI